MNRDNEIKQCNRNCKTCRSLNVKTDTKSYPYAYECMKFDNSVLKKDFESTKYF